MRSRFDEQLALLNREMIEMGALCEEVIASAAKALLEKLTTDEQIADAFNALKKHWDTCCPPMC